MKNIQILLSTLLLSFLLLSAILSTATAQDNRQNQSAFRRNFSSPETLPSACGEPKDAKIKESFFLPDPVFFQLNKYDIEITEWSKIENLVAYLNENPDSKVVITGYADKNTGNPTYNLKLSENRSKAIAKVLGEKYGIALSRISTNWKGDMVQPFETDNEKNRLVLFLINHYN